MLYNHVVARKLAELAGYKNARERGLKLVIEEGDARSCGLMGDLYKGGREVPQDMSRAAALYEKSCDGGALEPCISLASLYGSCWTRA